MTRTSQQQSWRSRLWQIFLRDRLGVLALAMVVGGFVCLLIPVGTIQGIGGIIFGTGLTVSISLWSNRQQAAKDTNLRRKTDFYGPLQAEMQALRERLEETQNGAKPYLQQIALPGQTPIQQFEAPPQLRLWSEFKADYRNRLEFSESSRQLFDQMLQLARNYNAAVEQALKTSEAAFAPYIKTAITQVEHSNDFQQWDKDHPGAFTLNTSSPLPNDWFIRIQNARATPPPQPIEVTWATWWLRASPMGNYRPATLGWLLAENPNQAAHAISSVLSSGSGDYPPPPLEWLKAIVDEAWPALESHPTYIEVRGFHEKLLKQVSQAETKLLDKLRDIQEMYEGGRPLL